MAIPNLNLKPSSMGTQPLGQAARGFGAALVGRLRIALVIATVVTLGALALYASPWASWRHAYSATQEMVIVIAAHGASSTYDAYVSRQEAERIARDIASGMVFSSFSFAEAVARTLAAQHDLLVSYFGADTPRTISSSDVAASLTATHTADAVSLTCHWSNVAGADALLSAAVSVLMASDDVRTLLPSDEATQLPDAALARTANSASPARLDPAATSAARQELLTRIVLGVIFGLIVALLLAWWSIRAAARAQERTPTASATSSGGR